LADLTGLTNAQYLAFAVLLILVVAEGYYAVTLQRDFYTQSGPFFDSLGYYTQMAHIWTRAREQGLAESLRAAWSGGTVFLPWVETAFLASFVPLTRELAVWLQSIWLLCLAWSLFYYFTHWRRVPTAHALILTLPFLAFRGIFYFNGGLSDFRMDLSLYLFVALAAVWYLATYETESYVPWVALGVFSGLACLNRATAPIYLAVMFGPPLACRIVTDRANFGRYLRRIAASVLPVLVLALPFLIANGEYLYFYYFVWNADANARLPLKDSIQHFGWAALNIGREMCLLLGIAGSWHLFAGWQFRRWSLSALFWSIDWKVAWLGIAPAAFLAVRGAGANPFVTMPCVLGMVMFALVPLAGKTSLRGWKAMIVSVLVIIGVTLNVRAAPALHLEGQATTPSMVALRQGIELLREDARDRGARKINFATIYVGLLHYYAMQHVILFDFRGRLDSGGVRDKDGILFTNDEAHRFTPAVPVDWQRLTTGGAEEERIQYLVKVAQNRLDCFFLPDDPTVELVERERPFFFMNTKVRAVKKALLATGTWERYGPLLDVRLGEKMEFYRRTRPR
jgi:hypothetical protein